MEQSVGGVHIPGDSHAYSAHQHNGFHMSAVNAGSGGMERLFWALPKIITQMFFVFFYKDNSMIFVSSAPGFSLTQELQGNTGCQFSSSPEESVFFQVGSFDRGLSHMSTVYTETWTNTGAGPAPPQPLFYSAASSPTCSFTHSVLRWV